MKEKTKQREKLFLQLIRNLLIRNMIKRNYYFIFIFEYFI